MLRGMSYGDLAVASAAAVIVGYLAKRLLSRSRSTLSLPPGPPGLPLIGNVFDMPQTQPHHTYIEWGQKYGPIMHVSVLGKSVVIINDVNIATDLLEKRAALYSERPWMIMGSELSGWSNALGAQPYGDRWREFRRHFHTFIGGRAALTPHESLLEHEARLLAQRLIDAPERLSESVHMAAGSVIMKITYGYNTLPVDDPLISLVNEALEQFTSVFEPSTVWAVDVFPILKRLPAWFPGAKFKRVAAYYMDTVQRMAQVPFDNVKKQVKEQTAEPSMTSSLLEKWDGSADAEHNIKWAAASMYGGGADTTVSSVMTFFMCMSLFPEVQKKAQAEIDAVVGRERLPTLADRPNLPYVEAVMNEALRWGPVAPMGVAHQVVQDDVYGDYHISKGSVIMPNVWAMLHDPAVYANPLEFDPERFIARPDKPAEPNPRSCCFGFGRRICPGRQLADISVWTELAVALAALSISKARDESGAEITPSTRYTDGVISHPEAFACDIRPRTALSKALVAQELLQFPRSQD